MQVHKYIHTLMCTETGSECKFQLVLVQLTQAVVEHYLYDMNITGTHREPECTGSTITH